PAAELRGAGGEVPLRAGGAAALAAGWGGRGEPDAGGPGGRGQAAVAQVFRDAGDARRGAPPAGPAEVRAAGGVGAGDGEDTVPGAGGGGVSGRGGGKGRGG